MTLPEISFYRGWIAFFLIGGLDGFVFGGMEISFFVANLATTSGRVCDLSFRKSAAKTILFVAKRIQGTIRLFCFPP